MLFRSAEFVDGVGNTTPTVSDTIVFDSTAPTGTVSIQDGADYFNSGSATMYLDASDATSGVANVRFSNDLVTWGSWTTYGTTAVPHTTYGYSSSPHTTFSTSYMPAGTAYTEHSRTERVGLDHDYGKVHKAPWHKNRNVDVTSTHLDGRQMYAPVTTASTHTDVQPYAQTHVDAARFTQTTWSPAAIPVGPGYGASPVYGAPPPYGSPYGATTTSWRPM